MHSALGRHSIVALQRECRQCSLQCRHTARCGCRRERTWADAAVMPRYFHTDFVKPPSRCTPASSAAQLPSCLSTNKLAQWASETVEGQGMQSRVD